MQEVVTGIEQMPQFLHVIIGPRQVGKTTAAIQVAAKFDYVVATAGQVWGLEVKSGRGGKTAGLKPFQKKAPAAKVLLVGGSGIPLEEFFRTPPEAWFRR